MSKSLPPIVLGLLAAACEPVTASVIELPTHDARVSIEDARAAGNEPDEKDSDTSEPEPKPEDCLELVDQTIRGPASDGGVLARSAVIARTGEAAGCVGADGGAPPPFSVFSLRDGKRMVERGRRYSYRWTSSVVMARVQLRGGSRACADEQIVNFEHGFQFAPKGVASCYEFEAPIDSYYVRTYPGDYPGPLPLLGLAAPPELLLCTTPCPPGTEHDFSMDAGTPALDGGITVPPIPTVP